LETRRLLAAATDLAAIGGLVFDDFTGNGFDSGEQVAGAALDLYLDDGDLNFDPTPSGGDVAVRMTITDAGGRYSFNRLAAGSYFVRQPAQPLLGLQEQVSPLIVISSTDAQGQIVTTIDTFDGTAQTISDSVSDGVAATSSESRAEAIGGERDLFVNLTSVGGEVRLGVNSLAANVLSFDAISNGNGVRRVSWDGPDGDATQINDTASGLNLNVTSTGSAAEGFNLRIGGDQAGGTAIIRLYSDDSSVGTANRFSTAMMTIPVTGGTAGTVEFIPFSSFSATSGGGVDFADIRAIEIEITGAANLNGVAELVGSVGQTLFDQPFDNFESSDLELTKTVNDNTPTTNQNITFTVTVDNNGPDNATGIEVTDQLPAGIAFVSNTSSQGNYNNATGVWTVGSLNSGASALLSIVGRVETTGQLVNTATITATDQTDGNSNNNQSSVIVMPESIDIALSKQVSNASPNVGENVTFTINAFNAGPSTATGLQVRDVLPAGLNFSSSSVSQGSYSNATGIWNVGSLNNGGTATLSILATVAANGSLTNTASLSAADQTDINNQNDQASITLSAAVADLALTKTVDVASPNVGDNVNFTITLSNSSGPNNATGVTVTDILPAGMSLITSSASQGSYDGGSGLWSVGEVLIGSSPTLTIMARVDSIGAKTNTAQISGSNQADPDSAPGNNQPGEDDQDSVTVTPTSADLELTKSVDNANPNVGETVTFTVNLANRGPDAATSVIVRDVIPTGMTFVNAIPSTGSYDSNTGLWSVGSVSSGGSASLMLRSRVDTTTTVVNTARVESADQFDPDSTPGNDAPAEDDQDSVTFTPASADLSLTKIVDDANPSVDDQVTFTITVSNSGPNAATGIVVLDQLPFGTSFVSATPTQGNYNQVSGEWTVGSLAVGATATLNIIAVAETTGLAVNTAEITAADQLDPDSPHDNNNPAEDDQATAEISPQLIDLSLTKTVSDSSPNVGEQVTFLITTRNQGPSQATGVTITESLPSGVTLVSSNPSQGSFNLSNGLWSVGSIAAGGQATISLLARIDSPGTGINTAQVTTADQKDVDSTPGNNQESEDDQASISFTTPVADLSVGKTVSNSTPNVGDTISFDVTVTNDGPDDATGVSLVDAVPVGMTFISNNLSTGTYDSGTGIWNIGGLASGNTATLELIARVDSAGSKINTARLLTADQNDPDSTPGNNVESEDDQASISLNPTIADLSLTKTASTNRPGVGENVTFTITLANQGPSDATGVNVTDLLPIGLNFVDADPSVGSYDVGTGIWNVGALAANNSTMLRLTARVDTLGDKTNTAEVTSSNQFDPDSTPGNNVAAEDDQASITITPATADLSLSKTVDDAAPNVGDRVTYTLTVNNSGPDGTSNVMVRDSLPSGVTFESAAPSLGSYDPSSRVWTIPSLPANGSATLEIRVVVDTPGDKTNSAEIIASSQVDPDSTPDNNIASEDDQASAVLSPELVDLALTKSLSNPAPNIGEVVTYTLGLTNEGPSTATGVAVTDRLPAGLTFDSATQTAGTYNPSTGVWSVGSVAVGATPTLTINAIVGSTVGGTNTAEVTAIDQPDSDSEPGNNNANEDDQASTTFTTQVADLSLNKTVDNEMPNQAQNVNFTLTLSNAGPDNATDIAIRDLLPAGLRFVSSSPSTGQYDPTTGRWTLSTLPAGASAILGIEAAVTSANPASNVAEVVAVRQFDPDSVPDNNVSSEDDYAQQAVMPQVVDISVSAAVDNPEPLEGETIRIVFTALNAGPAAATGVQLNTLLPLGLTLISSQPQTGSYNSVTGLWDVGNLASGATTQLVLNARVDTRGVKTVPIEVTATDQFDVDSTPNNNVPAEDDQSEIVIRAPRLLNKRLFMSR
jgi:uncharacterized repeat protein (TIGR01451 family)